MYTYIYIQTHIQIAYPYINIYISIYKHIYANIFNKPESAQCLKFAGSIFFHRHAHICTMHTYMHPQTYMLARIYIHS